MQFNVLNSSVVVARVLCWCSRRCPPRTTRIVEMLMTVGCTSDVPVLRLPQISNVAL